MPVISFGLTYEEMTSSHEVEYLAWSRSDVELRLPHTEFESSGLKKQARR